MKCYGNNKGNGEVGNVNPVDTPVPNQQAAKDYLTKHFGNVSRALSMLFASLSLIYSFLGFFDEFRDNVPTSTSGRFSKTYYIKGYGHGYQAEILNQVQLGIFSLCFVFSLVIFIVNKFAKRWSKRDRCLHFVCGAILFIGWVCGFIGTNQFVSHCCHVTDHGNPCVSTYHESSDQGYPNRCMCNLTVRWKPEYAGGNNENLNTTEFWNAELYNKTANILKAVPHHYDCRTVVLVHGFLWLLLYAVAIKFTT